MFVYYLKIKRLEKGYTQKQLSRKSGVSKSMISAIENTLRHPTIPVIHELARALKVDITDLYEKIN
jgi:transcriptional regulator with XRE-family HTH domain